jgi:hypothetical protein
MRTPAGITLDAWKCHSAEAVPLRLFTKPTTHARGFEGFGWHSFRRQNLTLMQEEGATTFETMAQAGHTRPSMTSEYTVVDLTRRASAVTRVQERLDLSSYLS